MGTSTYFEDLQRAELREAERAMIFAALRQRRASVAPRGIVVAFLRLLGARA